MRSDHCNLARPLFAAIALLASAVLPGCSGESGESHGPYGEHFFSVLEPAARECVLGAIAEERLESTLASLADLGQPHDGLPHDLQLLAACTPEVNVRRAVARVVLSELPRQRSRLMLAQEDTPDDENDIRRRLAQFPRQMKNLYRFQGFERRGPARLSVVYQQADVPQLAQSLTVDLLAHPGQHPLGWTAGEIVAMIAFDARDKLIAAGVHYGIAWARFVAPEDGRDMQIVTWGDVDGSVLYRAQGASRDVLAELLRVFRSGA